MNLLRRLFGPSRETIWRQLSTELGATYVKGGFGKGDRVVVTHGEWTLVLDTFVVTTGKSTVVFTRMRAPYVNPDGFRFTIYKRGMFSDVAKWFGMQDVEIGHPDFDRDFIIKGTDESRLRQLFADGRLRELIAAQPKIHFEVRDDEGHFGPTFPADTDELRFHVIGIIKDTARLKQLFDLFAETLDQLCRIGSAYEKAPDVKL
jgi:hypothetical protein